MNHKITKKEDLQHPYLLLQVQLIPGNESEIEAIKKVGLLQGNDSQKELVENYLLFGLGTAYSVISIEKQINLTFILKAAKN